MYTYVHTIYIPFSVYRSRSKAVSLTNDRLYELPSNGSMLKTLSAKPSVNDDNGTNGSGALMTSFAPLNEEPEVIDDSDKKEDLSAYLEAERSNVADIHICITCTFVDCTLYL